MMAVDRVSTRMSHFPFRGSAAYYSPARLFLPISEPLYALHATRARLQELPCPSDPNACSACGSYLHTGRSQSRLARSKAKKRRILRTTCLACGKMQTSAFHVEPSTNTAAQHLPSPVPDIGDTISLSKSASVTTQLAPALAATRIRDSSERSPTSTSVSQTPRTGAAGKIAQARPKKKTGLQAMLARNREQEQERMKSNTKQDGGLSAFLNGL